MREWTVQGLLDAVASREPVPGGGAVAALAGAAAAALLHMVTALAARRAKAPSVQQTLTQFLERAQHLQERFEDLADADVAAYRSVAEVLVLPRATDEESAARSAKLQVALRRAAEVPLETARVASETLRLAVETATFCPRVAQSDLVTAVHLAHAACLSALANVDANALSLDDSPFRRELAHAHSEVSSVAHELRNGLLDPLQAALGGWRTPDTSPAAA